MKQAKRRPCGNRNGFSSVVYTLPPELKVSCHLPVHRVDESCDYNQLELPYNYPTLKLSQLLGVQGKP